MSLLPIIIENPRGGRRKTGKRRTARKGKGRTMARRGRNGRFVKGGTRRTAKRRASPAPARRRRASSRRRVARRSARRYTPVVVRRRRRHSFGGLGGAGSVGLSVSGAKVALTHGGAILAGMIGPTAIIAKLADMMENRSSGPPEPSFLRFSVEKPWGSIAAHAILGILGGLAIRKFTKSNTLAAAFAGAAVARPLSVLLIKKIDPDNAFGTALGDDYDGFGDIDQLGDGGTDMAMLPAPGFGAYANADTGMGAYADGY